MDRWITLAVLLVACGGHRGEGEPCGDDDDCFGGLVCTEGRCAVNPALHQRMAQQSGVEVSSERGSAGVAPGAVRVRSAAGYEYAAAVCAADERLIGGWCTPAGDGGENAKFTRVGAADYSATDTIGAKWTCQLRKNSVRAHAMCQRLE